MNKIFNLLAFSNKLNALLIVMFIIGYLVNSSFAKDNIPYVKAIYSKPLTLDPSKMNDIPSLQVSELIYEGLVRFSETYQIIPALAQSWQTSKDGLELVFILKDGIKFQDGSPITSKDVIYSLTRNLSSKSLVATIYNGIEGAQEYFEGKKDEVSGLEVISNTKFKIKLTKPYSQFLYVLAGSTAKVLPEKYKDDPDFFSHPIGAGPFEIKNISDKLIQLKRNSHYYGEVKLSELNLRVEDEKEAKQLAKNETVHDLSSYPLGHDDELFKSNKSIDSQVSETWIIGLNTSKKVFQDIEQRRLFNLSIDTNKFREKFYPKSLPATNIVPYGYLGNIKSTQIKSKLTKPTMTEVHVAIPRELERNQEISEFLYSELKSHGWKPVIEILPWDELMKKYVEKSMDAFLVSMNIDYPDAMFLFNNFHSENKDNFSQIKDKTIDELILASKQTQLREDKKKNYETLAKHIDNLALTVNLFYPKAHQWISKCVRKYTPSLISLVYTDYRKVYLDEKCLGRKN